MLTWWKNSSPLMKFLIKAGGLYLLWNLTYYSFLKNSPLDTWLSANVAQSSAVGLQLIGYDGTYSFTQGNAYVGIGNKIAVIIGHPCNGLILYALFAGFILAYNGDWKLKLLVIPVGVFLIYFINIVRCMLLAIDYVYRKNSFELNHKFTYTIVVYAIIFTLWMLWANKLSDIRIRLNFTKNQNYISK
ncbi:MAG: exosortase/archaeosortase family protein [Cytophagales bacterium]|nr:exosortase/archaeosortase family protein [Cytophagales bacterium]MDW8384341.1 archaeosortase/exosortase family protein [Flammeovirgaceae bacterium]